VLLIPQRRATSMTAWGPIRSTSCGRDRVDTMRQRTLEDHRAFIFAAEVPRVQGGCLEGGTTTLRSTNTVPGAARAFSSAA